MTNDADLRRELKRARRADEEDPIVMYVQGTMRRMRVYCRVCGPKRSGTVPARLSDALEVATQNPLCDSCGQPCLRPGRIA